MRDGSHVRSGRWVLPDSVSLPRYGAVHVWRFVYTGTSIEQWLATLGGEEKCRANSFQAHRDRQRYIERHGVLRHVLAAYIGARPEQLKMTSSPAGKPYIAEIAGKLEFNLSHSGLYFAIAVSRAREVGIDIEVGGRLRNWGSIARNFFHAEELEMLCNIAEENREAAFLQLWTAKEALLKARGCGLLMPLPRISFDSADNERSRLQFAGFQLLNGQHWMLEQFPAMPHGCYGALALKGCETVDVEWFECFTYPQHILNCFS